MRHSAWRRVVVAVALAVLLVVGRVTPAGAFLSSLDPAGWAVVAQMAAIISQGIAIKRQVENYRNQARAEFFGKLAPLTGKLAVASRWLHNARNSAHVTVYSPSSHTALLPASIPAFNRPLAECSADVRADDEADPVDSDGADPPVPSTSDCMPPTATDAVLPSSALDDVHTVAVDAAILSNSRSTLGQLYGAGADTRIREVHDARKTRAERALVIQQEEVEQAERERALRRSLIEVRMGVIEDWRGCQEAEPGVWTPPDPTVDDRIPCLTNDGKGREDAGVGRGTQGLRDGLAARIEALQRYQDGDASQVQLDTLQTELLLTLGRIEAARTEAAAMEDEREQRRMQEAEARRRHVLAIRRAAYACSTEDGANPYTHFVLTSNPGAPVRGRCVHPRDAFADAVAAASASCLIPGQCAATPPLTPDGG